jgi:hypothetical protein
MAEIRNAYKTLLRKPVRRHNFKEPGRVGKVILEWI